MRRGGPLHISEVLVATLTDVVVSRRKSIATLDAEVSEWTRQAAALPPGDGRKAVESIVRVKEQRLKKLRSELAALEAVAAASAPPAPLDASHAKRGR